MIRSSFFLFFVSLSLFAAIPPELKHSEISKVFSSDAIPEGLVKLRELSEIHGEITETLIPFSDTPFHTNLEEPRIVLSSSPKFFYGAIPRLNGSIDFEFISWNHDRGEYDFGLISQFGTKDASIALADKNQCRSCHRTLGPLFTDRPWTNVTGANLPIGTYLSLAILKKMVQREPARFDQYSDYLSMKTIDLFEPAFGNLRPEPAIKLGALHLHGTPIFQLRGSFDLDANMRRGHYLMHSHQILKALPQSEAIQFAKSLIEKALLGMVYPEQLHHLFAWNEYLDTWVKNHEVLKVLPGNQSPVLKNYQPLFDHPALLEKAGVSEVLVAEDPVEALVKLSDYVQKHQISAYPAEELPSSGKSFVEFKPNHNGGADTALGLLCNFSKSDARELRQYLKKRNEGLEVLFKSQPWLALWKEPRFPSREEMIQALGLSLSTTPLEKPREAQKGNVAVTFTPAQRNGHSCLSCHGGPPQGTANTFLFDPLDRKEWDQRLADVKDRERTERFGRAILEKLTQKLMPPPESNEAKSFLPLSQDWQSLVEELSKRFPSQ